MTVEADVVQFLYRNPHSFLQLNRRTPSGNEITWAVEWGAGGQLGSQGVQRDTLRPGDHVIVVGSAGTESRRPPPAHDQHQAPVRWLDVGGHVRLSRSSSL